MRMSCWFRLNTRSLTIVSASQGITDHLTPRFSTAVRKTFACSSSPARPDKVVSTPRAARFTATLPAPPGRSSTSPTLTTGTGASGLIRVALPCQNRSSMTSPTTSTLAFWKSGILAMKKFSTPVRAVERKVADLCILALSLFDSNYVRAIVQNLF